MLGSGSQAFHFYGDSIFISKGCVKKKLESPILCHNCEIGSFT